LGFSVLGRLAAPEDKVANPFRTHNSGLGQRIRAKGTPPQDRPRPPVDRRGIRWSGNAGFAPGGITF
jgi:hypothetical protein